MLPYPEGVLWQERKKEERKDVLCHTAPLSFSPRHFNKLPEEYKPEVYIHQGCPGGKSSIRTQKSIEGRNEEKRRGKKKSLLFLFFACHRGSTRSTAGRADRLVVSVSTLAICRYRQTDAHVKMHAMPTNREKDREETKEESREPTGLLPRPSLSTLDVHLDACSIYPGDTEIDTPTQIATLSAGVCLDVYSRPRYR